VGRVFFTQYRKGRSGIESFRGNILEHARKLGVEIAAECGGLGTCRRCVVRIGNAALAGAREMLLSLPMRRTAEAIAAKIEHTKPNERESDFPYMVAEKMYF